MKKIITIFFAIILVLITGCTKEAEDDINQAMEDKVKNSEQISEEDTSIKVEIDLDEDMIINFDDAFGIFEIPGDVPREVVVGEYSENFPVELQEILVNRYNGVYEEEDNNWQEYEADCEIITLETCGDIPFEDIVNGAGVYGLIDKRSMRIVDIDRDGIDEYVIRDSIGRGQLGCIYVIKYVDEKWTCIGGGNARYSTDVCRLLEYEDRYYLLVGENLSYWRDGIEIPDGEYWELWDAAPWQADCWNSLEIKREITDYTPFETYSCLQDETVDYLLNVNLIALENNSIEEEKLGVQSWSVNGRTSWLEYAWEEEYAGEKYFYVVSTIDDESDDMLLTVLCDNENGKKKIMKVYYLSANYNIWFEEKCIE